MALSKNPNSITLVDVARVSGVSLKTASRVLNQEVSVRRATATKVRNVMSSLGYRPNELARGLKSSPVSDDRHDRQESCGPIYIERRQSR